MAEPDKDIARGITDEDRGLTVKEKDKNIVNKPLNLKTFLGVTWNSLLQKFDYVVGTDYSNAEKDADQRESRNNDATGTRG